MEIEYDPAKDLINRSKHGGPLSTAKTLDWDNALYFEDRRQNYGERRYVAFATLGYRLFCLVFTPRNNVYRVISLRKANAREVERYVSFKENRKGPSLH